MSTHHPCHRISAGTTPDSLNTHSQPCASSAFLPCTRSANNPAPCEHCQPPLSPLLPELHLPRTSMIRAAVALSFPTTRKPQPSSSSSTPHHTRGHFSPLPAVTTTTTTLISSSLSLSLSRSPSLQPTVAWTSASACLQPDLLFSLRHTATPSSSPPFLHQPKPPKSPSALRSPPWPNHHHPDSLTRSHLVACASTRSAPYCNPDSLRPPLSLTPRPAATPTSQAPCTPASLHLSPPRPTTNTMLLLLSRAAPTSVLLLGRVAPPPAHRCKPEPLPPTHSGMDSFMVVATHPCT